MRCSRTIENDVRQESFVKGNCISQYSAIVAPDQEDVIVECANAFSVCCSEAHIKCFLVITVPLLLA